MLGSDPTPPAFGSGRLPQVASSPDPTLSRPHLIYLAIGFPPAAKSAAYRLRETANQFRKLGWDVTVVTIRASSWERESGLDYSLSEGVDPDIRVVQLPLARDDLETDIRRYDENRALRPARWIKELRKREIRDFPEPVFGGWRRILEQAALGEHARRPADLLLVTCTPYVALAAAWKLWEKHAVPYAVDFRDGWSIDVVKGGEAFPPDSESGEWERTVLERARSFWVVNDPIAEFYRDRFPEIKSRIHVVRNGYDADSIPGATRRADPSKGMTFGYLGTVNFSPHQLEKVLEAWRAARRAHPVLARSRIEVRGHIGMGAGRESNSIAELLRSSVADDVHVDGPVRKADVAKVYSGWDALLLILVGGRYVTSGKVYEYMATGLPIVSAHEVEHDASHVLTGHPLWTGPAGLDEAKLTAAFVRAAEMALNCSDSDRDAARAHSDLFTREHLMREAVQRLARDITGIDVTDSQDSVEHAGGGLTSKVDA